MSRDPDPTPTSESPELDQAYRLLFEQLRDMVFISRPDGRLIDINQAGVEMFGYASKAEALAMDIPSLYVDQAQRDEFIHEVATRGFAKDVELELRSRDDRRLVVHGTASALRSEGGELVGILGILRDVTTQRQLEEHLRQSQKMEAVGRLAGGIAHDFNNMLTAINGYSQLLDQMPLEGPQKTYVGEIRKAGRRAAELTANLLRISRRQVLHLDVADLGRLVRELEGMLQQMIGEDVRLETAIDPHLGRVEVDVGQIEQALLNLAVNARDAMPRGGELAVTLENVDFDEPFFDVPAGSYVRMSVSDTGTGIEPGHLERIFEPLFTTKEKGRGTGFGLAMVYAAVTRSKGYIQVDTTVGRGTVFNIYLPRASDQARRLSEPDDEAPSEHGDERILLVEDDASVRALVREVLEHHGYTVLAARSAEEALEISAGEGGEIDLLVSDVVMPSMSGPDLAHELAGRHPHLKILFMSGYNDAFASRHGLSEQRHVVLQKPFGAGDLASKVRAVLDAA